MYYFFVIYFILVSSFVVYATNNTFLSHIILYLLFTPVLMYDMKAQAAAKTIAELASAIGTLSRSASGFMKYV